MLEIKTKMKFHYKLNEQDSLHFKPHSGNDFELSTKGEASSLVRIGFYENNRWVFYDDNQRELFFVLIQQNPIKMKRAFLFYYEHLYKSKKSFLFKIWRYMGYLGIQLERKEIKIMRFLYKVFSFRNK